MLIIAIKEIQILLPAKLSASSNPMWLTSHAQIPGTNHSLPVRLVCGTNQSENDPNLPKFMGWTRAALTCAAWNQPVNQTRHMYYM